MLYFVLVSSLFFLGGGIFVLNFWPCIWPYLIDTYTSRGVGNKFETYVFLQKMFESFLYNFTKYIWICFYPIISRMNLDLESKRIFFNIII